WSPLLVMKASAGSGKTFQLARKYILLLISQYDVKKDKYTLISAERYNEFHEHILAITFTNAATNEMKARIVKELYLLSKKRGPHISYLRDLLGVGDDQIAATSSIALQHLLFGYSSFNVSTIDAFFQSIMRSFAYELDLDADYNLEIGDDVPMKFALQSFMSRLAIGDYKGYVVDGWLRQFVESKLTSSTSWNVYKSFLGDKSDLYDLARDLKKEIFVQRSADITRYLSDVNPDTNAEKEAMAKMQRNVRIEQFYRYVNDKSETLDKECTQLVEDAVSIFNSLGLNAEEVSKSSSGKSKNEGRPLITFLGKVIEGKDRDAAFNYGKDKVPEVPDGNYDLWFTKDSASKSIADAHPSECQRILELVKQAFEKWIQRNLFKAIANNLYLFGLLGLINKELERYRHDNNTVLLGDTNEMLLRLLETADTGFVFEKSGMILRHFLIDEFQDTSAMQYKNLRTLLDNSVAGLCENLIIGDEKQSIYRFRNSDFKLLHKQVGKDYGDLARIDTGMRTNWRSSQAVIDFNNSFFTSAKTMLGVDEIYDNVSQEFSGKNMPKGLVKINFYASSGGKEDCMAAMPGHILALRDRGYKFKDIAILVYSHSDGNAVVEQIMQHNARSLKENKIDVLSNESLLLKNSSAVRIIVNNLRYLSIINECPKPDDEEYDSEELKKLKGKDFVSLEKIQRLGKGFQALLDDSLRLGNKSVGELLSEYLSKAKGELTKSEGSDLSAQPDEELSLVAVVERVIRTCLTDEARRVDSTYIHAFQDVVLDFAGSGAPTLQAFLRWWDKASGKLSVVSPAEMNAVNVMTIHKSKGLEFPVVILPKVDWNLKRGDDAFWATDVDLKKLSLFNDVPNPSIIPPFVKIPNSSAKQVDEVYELNATERMESLIDNLNKTYVGFTRAKNEMHIYAPVKMGKKGPEATSEGTVSQVLFDAINTSEWAEMPVQQPTADGFELTYAFGEEPSHYSAEEKKIDTDMPEFEETEVVIDSYEPFDRFITVHPKSLTIRQELGIKVHNLFGKIGTVRDLPRVMTWAKHRGHFGDDMAMVERLVHEAIEAKPELFDDNAHVFNEYSIFAPDPNSEAAQIITKMTSDIKGHADAPKQGVMCRPDRLVELPGGEMVVVDFKVSEKVGAQSHKVQVSAYRDLLRSMGYDARRAFLCYLSTENGTATWVEV
ncbi:MAG: UvrD-helicase domain-containing protein, partial [Muribaculaceae bacterium]|nr:UvrD-helicase domain-containing protein [Muribaculaceae bacterium]